MQPNNTVTTITTMTRQEQTFYTRLGLKIATLRNERGMTQVQLAQALGISQQHLLSFEKGRRRVPVSALPALSKALGTSVEDLLGTNAKPGKRGPSPKIQRQLERLKELPKSQQRFVHQMLEGVLQQAGR